MREVICTSRDGDRFWSLPECYIRGNTIKYLRIPDEVIDMVQEEDLNRKERQALKGRGRGGRGGRGGKGGRGRGRGKGRGRGGQGGRGKGGKGKGKR